LEPIVSNTSTPKISEIPTSSSSLPQINNPPTKAQLHLEEIMNKKR
jgi:hypothetical protein